MLSRDVRYMEVKENEDGMSAACLQAQSAFVRSIQIKKPLWIFKVAWESIIIPEIELLINQDGDLVEQTELSVTKLTEKSSKQINVL